MILFSIIRIYGKVHVIAFICFAKQPKNVFYFAPDSVHDIKYSHFRRLFYFEVHMVHYGLHQNSLCTICSNLIILYL